MGASRDEGMEELRHMKKPIVLVDPLREDEGYEHVEKYAADNGLRILYVAPTIAVCSIISTSRGCVRIARLTSGEIHSQKAVITVYSFAISDLPHPQFLDQTLVVFMGKSMGYLTTKTSKRTRKHLSHVMTVSAHIDYLRLPEILFNTGAINKAQFQQMLTELYNMRPIRGTMNAYVRTMRNLRRAEEIVEEYSVQFSSADKMALAHTV